MLHIELPFADVLLLLFFVKVFTVSMRLVILEITCVAISIRVQEFTLAICFAIDDVASVRCTIGPVQRSLTMRNENELILAIMGYRILGSGFACRADHFHLTCVPCSVGVDLIVLLFNQMLIWKLVN